VVDVSFLVAALPICVHLRNLRRIGFAFPDYARLQRCRAIPAIFNIDAASLSIRESQRNNKEANP
jgi:hypothetical protein